MEAVTPDGQVHSVSEIAPDPDFEDVESDEGQVVIAIAGTP